MSTETEARIFQFGGFRLNVAQRQLLTIDGEPIDLPSRAFDLLQYLVERPGELLDKSTLLKGIWPRTVVEESNLSQCIFALRRALGDTAQEHRFIVTVPGRGYQFVAKVHIIGEMPSESATAAIADVLAPGAINPTAETARSGIPRFGYVAGIATLVTVLVVAWLFWPRTSAQGSIARPSATALTETSIAVLPFADLSSGKDMEYFADGIAEELMSSLAMVDSLRVIGRRSAFTFKDKDHDAHTIGEKLNVQFLLEGSVRKEGDRIRISTQLTRTKDGVSLWAENYDRKLDDVLDIQGAIARQVVASLGPTIRGPLDSRTSSAFDAKLTHNAEAYRAYLRGVHLYKQHPHIADGLRVRDEFLNAVELDPQFALAHAWLAGTYNSLNIGDAARNKSLASESLDRALKLDPTIADIWWVRQFFLQGDDVPLAVHASGLERAIAANPGDSLAMRNLALTYFLQGRRAEGLEVAERIYAADPLWIQIIESLGYWTYLYRGDRQRLLMSADEIENLAPQDPTSSSLRALLAYNEGRALDWDRWTTRAIEADPRNPWLHYGLAWNYAVNGQSDAAQHHARISALLNPATAHGVLFLVDMRLNSGDIADARKLVQQARAQMPEDSFTQLALADLQYNTDDCAGFLRSSASVVPAYAKPTDTLDLSMNPAQATVFVWCLRRQGNTVRAAEIGRMFDAQFAPPTAPGMFDGWRARMAVARGDRAALVTHLTALAQTKSMSFAFGAREPMIQPYLHDPEVKALLDRLEARNAEWRRIVPKSSMRVPIPGITAADAAASLH